MFWRAMIRVATAFAPQGIGFAVDVARRDLGNQRIKPDQFGRFAVNAIDKCESAVAL